MTQKASAGAAAQQQLNIWTTVRYRLVGETLPPMSHAVVVCERFKTAVLGALGQAFPGPTPDAFRPRYREGATRSEHIHPFHLAEDADGDGGIDHLVLHVPLTSQLWVLPALDRAQPFATTGPLPQNVLRRTWHGGDASDAPGSLLRPAHVWRSATPYVPDRLLRDDLDVRAALITDLEGRGLRPIAVEELAGPLGFVVERSGGDRPASFSGTTGSWFKLVFAEAVVGPLALGFACHMGLGCFRHAPP